MDEERDHSSVAWSYEKKDRCVNCGTTGELHNYDSELHCNNCLNQRLAMEL